MMPAFSELPAAKVGLSDDLTVAATAGLECRPVRAPGLQRMPISEEILLAARRKARFA